MMKSEKPQTTESLIFELRALMRLSDDLSARAREIRAELALLEERLGIYEVADGQIGLLRSTKVN